LSVEDYLESFRASSSFGFSLKQTARGERHNGGAKDIETAEDSPSPWGRGLGWGGRERWILWWHS